MTRNRFSKKLCLNNTKVGTLAIHNMFAKSALLILVVICALVSFYSVFVGVDEPAYAKINPDISIVGPGGSSGGGSSVFSYTFMGEGTESNPYLIGTFADFKALAECGQNVVNSNNTPYVKCFYKVIADIDMQNSNICIDYFGGTFDGDYHRFINIKNERSATVDCGGLFIKLDSATVKNVILYSGNVKGYEYVGGLAAYAVDSTIIGCVNVGVKVEQTALRKYDYDTVTDRSELEGFSACYGSAGGLIGAYFLNKRWNYYSSGDNGVFVFSECSNYARVTSARTAGGIVGMIFDDRVRYRAGNNITAYLTDCIPINQCRNSGTITANPRLVKQGYAFADSRYWDVDQSLLISCPGGIVGEIMCYGLRYYSYSSKDHVNVSLSK